MSGAAGGIGSGSLAGTVIGGRYRLLALLGRGGMAQVWRGLDQRLDREVAVKILDGRDQPDACQRFEREARTAAALTHPHIVGLHDAGSDDGVDYLVMELVEGETLAQRIRRAGPLPIAEVAEIAGQICDALAAAHAAGIVHRDVKPGNILISNTGGVKMCDFGIACHDNDTPDASELAVGTAQYMAPEQARGGPATPRTDLYSLGCVIYAMTTGHPPFSAKTSTHVAWQHLNESPVRLASRRPGAPSWLDSLVTSLLAKDPAQRPVSATEVRGLLAPVKPALERAGTSVLPGEPGEPTIQLAGPGKRIRLATMGVLSFLGLASIVLVFTAISANDMPVARLNLPAQAVTPSPAQTPAAINIQPVSDPGNALDALRAALDDQVRQGNISGKPLRQLDGKLDEIERDLYRGEEEKAADKLADFAKTLADLRRDGRIGALALAALQPALGELADQLPGESISERDD